MADLERSERLHGEELGGPQLKVEAEAVEEGPGQHHWPRPQPHDGHPVGAHGGQQLLQHVVVLPAQVVVHVPADDGRRSAPLARHWEQRSFYWGTTGGDTHLHSQSLIPLSK